jgi:hypothetical protein
MMIENGKEKRHLTYVFPVGQQGRMSCIDTDFFTRYPREFGPISYAAKGAAPPGQSHTNSGYFF